MNRRHSALMLVVLTALSLGGLALLVLVGQPLRPIVSLTAEDRNDTPPELIPYSPGEQLAERVLYSELFVLDNPSRLTIRLEGHGIAHVALVSESNGQVRVHEEVLDAPETVQFGRVGPGEWWLRANTGPDSSALRATAFVGGYNPTLVWFLALLLSTPLLLRVRKAYSRHHASQVRS